MALSDDLAEIATQQLVAEGDLEDDYDEIDRILGDLVKRSTVTSVPRVKEVAADKLPGRFAEPKSDQEVEAARAAAVPKNTAKNMQWATRLWREWGKSRRQRFHPTDCPPHLLLMTNDEMNRWLSLFILEARREDGSVYSPETLYQLSCGLLRVIRELRPHINILKDAEFAPFQKALDSEMKRLRSLGVGVKKKQAEPISLNEEQTLWDRGLLGAHSPQSLLDTMVYLCGINFALRSGQDHRSLTVQKTKKIQSQSLFLHASMQFLLPSIYLDAVELPLTLASDSVSQSLLPVYLCLKMLFCVYEVLWFVK